MGQYIGKTKQYLESRIYENKYSIRKKFRMYHASHSTNLGHNFDFSNHNILVKERNLEKILNNFRNDEILNNKNSITQGQI